MRPVNTKVQLDLPWEVRAEIAAEAARLDRSLSWTVQRAWKAARLEIRSIVAPEDTP